MQIPYYNNLAFKAFKDQWSNDSLTGKIKGMSKSDVLNLSFKYMYLCTGVTVYQMLQDFNKITVTDEFHF